MEWLNGHFIGSLVPTDFLMAVIIPSIFRAIWVFNQRIARIEAMVDTIMNLSVPKR